jgi:hypothetical protein
MTLPPRHLVEEALLYTVLPPFAAAAAVAGIVLLVFRRKAGPFAASLGFVLAFVAALWTDPIVPWTPTMDKRNEWLPSLGTGACLPALLLGPILLVSSFLKRPIGECAGLSTVVWAAVLVLFATKVCPAKYLKEPWYAAPGGAALLTAAWLAPAAFARRIPGATAALVVGMCLLAASGVAIHARAKQLMDLAVVAGVAMSGLALVSLVYRVDLGGAIPGGIAVLGGVLVNAYYNADDECKVPQWAYLLPAVAPLLCGVALLPGVRRAFAAKSGAVRYLSCLVLLGFVGAVLAASIWGASAEQIDFESL